MKRQLCFLTLAVGFALSSITLTPAHASVECPKPEKTTDPFADFDDLMTEDEKREALHIELDRKLAQHKSRCETKQNQQKPVSSSTKTTAVSGSNQSEGQQANQASSNGDATNNAQSQNPDNPQSQEQADSGNNASQQQKTTNQAAAHSNQTAQYSSPWANQQISGSGAGKVTLEPMAEPSPKPTEEMSDTTPEAMQQLTPQNGGANGTGEQSKQQESLFLKTYGGQSALETEKIEDIAGRSAAGDIYGSPGNTGLDQQKPYYPATGRKPAQTATISADDAVVAALTKRLKTETDPEKRKEIQAEIDKYEKK